MGDKPIAFVVALAAMAACCLGVPLLLTVAGGAGIVAWVSGEGIAWLGLAAFVVLAIALYRRSRRRGRIPYLEGRSND